MVAPLHNNIEYALDVVMVDGVYISPFFEQTEATTEPAVPAPNGWILPQDAVDPANAGFNEPGGIHRTLWWKYRPSSSGSVRFHTLASPGNESNNNDTEFKAYTLRPGGIIRALSPVTLTSGGNDNGPGYRSDATFDVVVGETYYLQIGNYNNNWEQVLPGIVLTVIGPDSLSSWLDLQQVGSTQSSIDISWNNGGAQLSGYEISVDSNAPVSSLNPSFSILDLEPESSYGISVRGYIETFTGHSDVSVVVASAASYWGDHSPEKAFDNDPASAWTVTDSVWWLQADFGSPLAVYRYSMRRSEDQVNATPRDWTIQGSNDGVSWVIVDTRKNISWITANEEKTFDILGHPEYRYLRMVITANQGNSWTRVSYLHYQGAPTDSFRSYTASDAITGTTAEDSSNVVNPPSYVDVYNVTTNSASVQWYPASSGITATSYEYSLDLINIVNVGLDDFVNLNGLIPNTPYTFNVRALGGEEVSSWKSLDFTTAMGSPNPPANLSASEISGMTAKLSWDSSSTGPEASGYEYSFDYGPIEQTSLREFTVDNLSPSTLYHLRVRSFNPDGYSEWVELEFSTMGGPEAPKNVEVVDITMSSARVFWSVSNSGPEVLSYEYSIDSGSSVNIGTNIYVDLSGLSENIIYSFAVRAVGEYGVSPWTTLVFKTSSSEPGIPTQVRVADSTSSTITFQWSPPNSGSFPVEYEYSFYNDPVLGVGSATQVTFTNLTSGNTYTFRVRSTNQYGVSEWVDLSAETNLGPPHTPINLSIPQVTQVSFFATWSRALTGPETVGYEVSFDFGPTVELDSEFFMAENLEPNHEYTLRVRAIGHFGYSPWASVDFNTLESDVIDTASKTLSWDILDERIYETGLDHGVLYLSNNRGVAWNGLTAIEESLSDESSEPLYLDGVKYLDVVVMGDYSATLSAILYPDEFLEYEGYGTIGSGIYADDQVVKMFGLSYRTLIGSAVEEAGEHYKLHLVYNLTASPENVGNQTSMPGESPVEFGWQISGVPMVLTGYRPTAHIILDSRYIHDLALREIEDILYGSSMSDARLPSIEELYNFLKYFDDSGTDPETGPVT